MSEARPPESNLRRIRSAGDVPIGESRASPSPQMSPTFPRSPEPSADVGRESTSRHPEQPSVSEHTHSESVPVTFAARPPRPPPARPPRQHNRSLYSRTMAFFGYGRGASRARRSIVSLVWNLSWGLTQIVIIITLLAFSGHLKSPRNPDKTEWHACDKPLGVWACLWVIRVLLACALTCWGFERDRQTARQTTESDAEAQGSNTRPQTQSQPLSPAATIPAPMSAASSNANAEGTEGPVLPHTLLYRRLSLFSSLFSLSWFLTAHILEYTSLNSCRVDSPHIWWLIFGILCITYLMVLEVIILGFVVFIIAPIIFLVWNVFLMCLGRHPLQNPHMIKPEIGKLPKSVVDSIPLVMYIPPPPDAPPSDGPVKIPEAAYTYPPKPPTPSTPAPKRRFKFLRFKGKKASAVVEEASSSEKTKEGKSPKSADEPQTWEDHFEQEGYPFVILEGNRAACAICLLDFEEPKRVGQDSKKQLESEDTPATAAQPAVEEIKVESITEEERDEQLRLQDAGEGPQPLRLLACGHVFHKLCVDPWLTDVSGRCPVCQRAVEIPAPEKKKRRRSR